MGIDPTQLLRLVIRPVCNALGWQSDVADRLLLATAAVESHCGEFLYQLPDGPAVGIYQMEPRTIEDVYHTWLTYRPEIEAVVDGFRPRQMSRLNAVLMDLGYATALARCHYRRRVEPLPDANNLQGLWLYYKKYFNSYSGKTTQARFLAAYDRFVDPIYSEVRI